MENGADAVFCGLKTFSARAKAKNFSLEELERLSGYTHSSGKKIYVALNTLIKEQELESLVDVLSALDSFKIDGLIIQDFGLYHLAGKYFPKLPLHASTQMAIHNSAGVRILEQMGFTRAVLARELSLQEIRCIREQTTMELEHFVHGALCYSISGHCLFSSYLDGRSGNRGGCVQPCRRRYSHEKQSGFYFSTSDFSAISLIPELIDAGVMSFKIEGRMKSPEYVATVVAAYRSVIDAARGERQAAVAVAKSRLKQAMGRPTTQGFLDGSGGSDIVLSRQKGGLGLIIGKVEQFRGKSISFKTGDVLHVGDRLRIQPAADRSGKGFTIRSLYCGSKKGKRAKKGTYVTIALPEKIYVNPGDTIFKLSTGKVFTMSEERAVKQLSLAPPLQTDVDLAVQCPGSCLTATAVVAGKTFRKEYQVETQPAERSPLTEETLYKVFCRTGHKQLVLKHFQAGKLPPVVIKPSRLKEIRRDFYKHLLLYVLHCQKEESDVQLCKAKKGLESGKKAGVGEGKEKLLLHIDEPDDQMITADDNVSYILDISPERIRQSLQTCSSKSQVIWDLPSIVFDSHWDGLQQMVADALSVGFYKFRLNNLSHFGLFGTTRGLQLSAGPWLYTLNNQCKNALQKLGVSYFCAVLEDDRKNLAALLGEDLTGKVLLTVYSPVNLFTSRIQQEPGNKNKRQEGTLLQNEKGQQFSIMRMGEVSVTRAPEPFSLLGRIGILRQMGCADFILDLRGTALSREENMAVIQAFYDDTEIPGTSSFNFDRGLK